MRHILSLNEAWSFRKEHQEATILDLPHTWNAADGMDGGGRRLTPKRSRRGAES